MNVQLAVSASLAGLGIALLGSAIWNERQMQHHRRPGITYRDVTLRLDGAWRRSELFTAAGGAAIYLGSRGFQARGIVLWHRTGGETRITGWTGRVLGAVLIGFGSGRSRSWQVRTP